jgi:hypothetical protein
MNFPTGLRAARVVASASTEATDCALLFAALVIHPGDGLRISSSKPTIVVRPTSKCSRPGVRLASVGFGLVGGEPGQSAGVGGYPAAVVVWGVRYGMYGCG